MQPEEDGWMLCLACGVWKRSLTHHVRAIHGQSAAEYREQFDLAPRTKLIAADLAAARAQRGRENYPLVADKFENRSRRVRRLALRRSITTRRQAAGRAGTRAQMQKVMSQRAEDTRLKAQSRLDDRAQQAGYRDLADLLARNENRRMREIGELLAISDRYAGELHRRQFPRVSRRQATRDRDTDAAGYSRRSQRIRDKHRAQWDAVAQQAGFPGMVAALAATAAHGATRQAQTLGVSKSMIYYMMRELNLSKQDHSDQPG